LLRADRANTPLGNPDALVHLLDWTLDEVFGALTKPAARRRLSRSVPTAGDTPECPCGRNPLLHYFAVGEQALEEALILAQASLPMLDPLERDAAMEELNLVLHQIARREIEAFCGVCVHRLSAAATYATEPVASGSNGSAPQSCRNDAVES
jgi:hypothetical protein